MNDHKRFLWRHWRSHNKLGIPKSPQELIQSSPCNWSAVENGFRYVLYLLLVFQAILSEQNLMRFADVIIVSGIEQFGSSSVIRNITKMTRFLSAIFSHSLSLSHCLSPNCSSHFCHIEGGSWFLVCSLHSHTLNLLMFMLSINWGETHALLLFPRSRSSKNNHFSTSFLLDISSFFFFSQAFAGLCRIRFIRCLFCKNMGKHRVACGL